MLCHTTRSLLAIALLAAGLLSGVAPARANYLDTPLDLATLLPPPPAQDSMRTRAELDELLALQAQRSAADCAAARQDAEETPFRFADVLGAGFEPGRLPATTAFLKRVQNEEYTLLAALKTAWSRPRPFLAEPRLTPCLDRPGSSSYPSRHNAFAMTTAEILAWMVPERRDALFERARGYGAWRMVGGVHYRTDTETGRAAGLIVAERLLSSPRFRTDLAQAAQELRGVLALPPLRTGPAAP